MPLRNRAVGLVTKTSRYIRDQSRPLRQRSALPKNFFVEWFETRGRDFPWRRCGLSPFTILITEVLLRQTTASSVAKLWENFTNKYRQPIDLANAKSVSLTAQLKRLGLSNQRAVALKHAARHLVKHHEGEVPRSLPALLKVPHVGNYSARAVLCFGFGEKFEIVDTNVLRFVARYYGLTVNTDNRRNPEIWKLAKRAMPRDRHVAQAHNYGLLDFTAEVCRSLRPKCPSCPLRASCAWARVHDV